MKLVRYLIVVLCLFVSGCAATGPKFTYSEPSLTQSKIYLYRKYSFVGSAASPNIYMDGEIKGKLHTGGYVLMSVVPGVHEVIIGRLGKDSPNWSPDNAILKLQVEPGAEYFLKMDMNFGGVFPIIIPIAPSPIILTTGKANIKIVTENKEQALIDLDGARRSD